MSIHSTRPYAAALFATLSVVVAALVLPIAGAAQATPAAAAGTAAQSCVRWTVVNEQGAIPDGNDAGLFSNVYVDHDFEVLDIDVMVNVTHTWDADLDIYLAGGDLGAVALSTDNGANGDNYEFTFFDDEASTSITAGTAPFHSQFVPESSLSYFDGHSSERWWALAVFDDSASEVGVLVSWELTITYACDDADGDNLDASLDNCPSVSNGGQQNADGDARGDACDNCPSRTSSSQLDTDHDGLGDICDPNDDNDAKPDSTDFCDRRAASTASGCPLRARSLSMNWKPAGTKWAGRLYAPGAPACHRARRISVWRERPGADLRIGGATTTTKGYWSLDVTRRKGAYYATSPRTVVTNVAECAKDRTARRRL